MAYTTQIFLFVFFPVCMVLYYVIELLRKLGNPLSKKICMWRISDLILIGLSACFYMWACFDDVFRLAIYVVVVFIFGHVIEKILQRNTRIVLEFGEDNQQRSGLALVYPIFFLMVTILIYILIRFKYIALISKISNFLFRDNVKPKSIMAPLGISFITFSAISYLADICTNKAKAGSFIDCALYLMFFPKMVSGPIILWRDFSKQLLDRKVTLQQTSDGVTRIMTGFIKKLILADVFGSCIATIPNAVDIPTAWGVSLLYMLQIYYDFSGYSDIAIGISKMMGFSIKENFHFPYLAYSISDFWRRWHISLGTWFREYVYIPLGGNKRGKKKTLLNILVVFLLTGIWHGAGWTYLLWGVVNGCCNILEKIISQKLWYQKTPKPVKWFVTITITFFCWELFRFEDIAYCIRWLGTMFGCVQFTYIPYSWPYYFDTRMIIFVVIGILGATLLGLPKIQNISKKIYANQYGYLICQLALVALFVVAILFMINSTYSPFIYFQF